MNYALHKALQALQSPPIGDLFLPAIDRCGHCEGSGTYKIWGMYDIMCVFCAGTGEDR